MSVDPRNVESRNERLDEIIGEYLRRKEGGESALEEELLAKHRSFAAELREFFDDESRVGRLLRPLRQLPHAEHQVTASVSSSESTTDLPARRPVLQGSRYRLDRFHDRGGMGEIWIGHDQRIGRDVAIKVLRPERAAQGERFQFEAQVSGQLEHPGIVRVYDYDLDSAGQPFYVMQFVRGRTLRDVIEECHRAGRLELDFHRLLKAMIDLCHIVAYAHSRGVLHRDLKPVNVMVGMFGETLVLDWGLAKIRGQQGDFRPHEGVRASGSGSTATEAGAILGSPQYLSPEAASGRVDDVDQASDVYLLGATLYEILTGRPPRQGSSAFEIVDLARSTEPPPPRSLNASLPRALDAICRKAMARAKQDRYASAMEMAGDLERYLAREPVMAYRENLLERCSRWLWRRRRAMARAAAALSLVAVAGFALFQWRQVELMRGYSRGAMEVAEFRRLSGEAHYLIASTDLISEEAPYYQSDAGERIGRQALTHWDRWSHDLSRLSLTQDAAAEQREKAQLREEIYELTLLLVQNRLGNSPAVEAARESLALLDEAAKLRTPTTGLSRMMAECHERLAEPEKGERAQRIADDPRTPNTALDHFLHGETLRRRTWVHGEEVADAARAAERRQLLAEALEEFNQATALQPDFYWARLQIGRCLLALGRYPEAIQALGGCVALRPEEPWAYMSRSIALALDGQHEQAIQELNRLISASPSFQPQLLLSRGFVHLLRHDDAQALADFSRILAGEEQEQLAGAAFYRSRIRERQGDQGGALADLNWLLSRDPGFAPAYLSRANLHLTQGRVSAGLEDLNAYLRIATESPPNDAWQASHLRGRLLLDVLANLPYGATTRELVEKVALRELQQATTKGANVPEPYQELGRLRYLRGEVDDALTAYSQGIVRCPDSPQLLLAKGWLLLEVDAQEAEQCFRAAARLDPANTESRAALGFLQAKSRDAPTAEQTALEALLLTTRNYTELFNIACVYGELGEVDAQHKERHQLAALSVLRRAIAVWHDQGAPREQSIPELMTRERNGAFRSLKSRPEFRELVR